MSGRREQTLFFVTAPDLRKLCGVFVSCPSHSDGDEGDLRNMQLKTCRELLFLYSDIIASPVLGSCGGAMVIMPITFFKRGVIQAYVQSHNLQLSPPQRVLPSTLQTCMSYSITARLAPNWNRAGHYLIAGKDFLTETGKQLAIVLELSVNETHLCISLEASIVRLPPALLEDFDAPPLVVKNFLSNPEAVLHNTVQNNWCYVLPSMKRGQIISISRKMPQECPFRSYTELRNHWRTLYGYHLPPLNENDVVYCSVYFKLLGEKLFTYPLSCIRTQPVQCFPRVDLQGAIGSFMSDLQGQFENICGFHARMTSKPCYHTSKLIIPPSQGSGSLPANLTTKPTSRPVLTQLPSDFSLGVVPKSGRPGGVSSLSQTTPSRGRVQIPGTVLECSHHRGLDTRRLSPACASLVPGSPPAPSASLRPSQAQSQPAPSAPKLVPIFKNKSLSRHVNVTKILAEKRQKKGETQGQSAPRPGVKKTHPSSFRPSSSSSGSATMLPPVSCPGLHRVSLPIFKGLKRDSDIGLSCPQQPHCPAQPLEIPSNRGEDVFVSHPKKPKVTIQDVDVVKYAKSNQLAKINAATLQAWLKGQGVTVRSKDKKEELVAKVMQCLREL